MNDYDQQKQRRIQQNRAKQAMTSAPKPAANDVENKRLKAENAILKAKLERAKGVAVEMTKRSARMSNVPGYVLKDFADQIIKHINSKN
jgi:hypothetical protein